MSLGHSFHATYVSHTTQAKVVLSSGIEAVQLEVFHYTRETITNSQCILEIEYLH